MLSNEDLREPFGQYIFYLVILSSNFDTQPSLLMLNFHFCVESLKNTKKVINVLEYDLTFSVMPF